MKSAKRSICLLLCALMLCTLCPAEALAAGNVAIDESNFPDGTFRDYVSSNFDLNGDGSLSQDEIDQITGIQVEEKGITSLKGIEKFPRLVFLYADNNSLTELDVTHNPDLEVLMVDSSQLKTIDVSQNPRLRELTFNYNQVTSVDLSRNPALEVLSIVDNRLTSLDISRNTELKVLACGNSSLKSLDISKNPKIEFMTCYNSQIKTVDISNNPLLKIVYGQGEKTETDKNVRYRLEISDSYMGLYLFGFDRGVKVREEPLKAPRITAQPKSKTVKAGKKVTFKVKAAGEELQYQWYVKKTGSKKWVKVKKATKPTLKFKATAKMNGYRYRCLVKNSAGKVYSKTVKLKVKKK